MAKRKLLKGQDRHELFDILTEDDSLIRHYSLSPADRLEIELRRRNHNQLGFAVQLCLMRYPGRTLMPSETPPAAMLNYIATQINADVRLFGLYARREETRRDHIAHLLRYLEMRSPTGEDRRAALLAGIEAASATDKGIEIAKAIIATFRERRVLLPTVNMIERMGSTGDVPQNIAAMLAGVLADGTNLGPKRMAGASKGISAHQIGWMRGFHARSETYRAAQAAVTDAHTRHPHSQIWGDGTKASSDGQFFRASDRAARRGDINLHYGSEPGTKFYSGLSDQYGYFSILPISPTESEAIYVLDGLFDHDTILEIEELFTDTGGASDHVFALFCLIGKRFAPRLRNIKDRKFHTFEKADAYPTLANHIGAPINTALIMEHWDELLRLAASITTHTVSPSAILKRLSASSKSSELARALRELGRIERTLFMIEWYSTPALRRRCQAGLNKGESAHKLKRAVFFHERGEIRDRSYESQAFRASGLNLVVSAIVHWNTVYLSRATTHLRQQGRDIPDKLLKHVSPLSWEHINLTGIYSWDAEQQMPEGFRPLRLPGRLLRAA